jgi:acetyl esterase/lipase
VRPPGPARHAYGSDPSQFGELYRPSGAAHRGTVVVIHGGFWRCAYDLSLGGLTAWNLEYRRVGNGGGWPGTLVDIAAGIDALGELDVDTSRVVAVGHSAGGHLAVWSAGRAALPAGAPGAAPRIRVTGVVSQAGVLDLAAAAAAGVGTGAVTGFLGGPPSQVPARYAVADPIAQVPLDAAVLCVHSRSDREVPFAQSTAYVAASTAAGGRAALHETTGDHFALIDPAAADWQIVRAALPSLLCA